MKYIPTVYLLFLSLSIYGMDNIDMPDIIDGFDFPDAVGYRNNYPTDLSKRTLEKRTLKNPIQAKSFTRLSEPTIQNNTKRKKVNQLAPPAKRTKTTKKVGFPCPLCPKILSASKSLKNHIQSDHTSQDQNRHADIIKQTLKLQPFPCRKGCNKRFTDSSNRNKHERIHTGEKPYPCRIKGCDKRFAQSGHRNAHERIHTGEKPFPCRKGCNKRFTINSSRNTHERTHTGEKPYPCRKGCNKLFTISNNRNRHERIHTGEKPYPCRK